MRKLIIKEDDYIGVMEQKVVPELEAGKREIRLERQPGKKIYCVHYKAEHPRGTVVISHGFTETAEKYAECIYYFLRMELDVFCIEHCGHGRSYRLTEDLSLVHTDSYERYVNDLLFSAEYIRKESPTGQLILYGHSMGGGIGAAAAAKRPELFSRVILSSPMIQPETRPVPWVLAVTAARLAAAAGKERSYVAGQAPYKGEERFEDSASVSRARFEYYQKKRTANPLYQMNAPSYGWFLAAAGLKHFLMSEGWKHLCMPVLVFQAEKESFVSNKAMEKFVRKANRNGNASLVRVEGAKHEIYNSDEKVLKKYWERIQYFIFG